MSSCPSASELSALLTERLDEQRRVEVSGHVDRCPTCQQTLEEMTAAVEFLGGDDPSHQLEDGPDPAVVQIIDRLRATGPPCATGATGATTHALWVGCDPRAPLSLDDFALGETLGRGGMGAVYRAVQKSLKKPVAVKVLEGLHSGNELLIARFLREARVAASLGHPNIVDVHGIGRTATGGYFLVMDLIEGCDLEKYVKADRQAIQDAAEIVATVADAIQHAHDHGIIHRDLKPSNVLLGATGEVMVTDFGIAKSLDLGGTSSTQRGQLLGTPSYMAPEQADTSRGMVGPMTDVYGLGGILYFLLTQRPPYTTDENGVLTVIAKVLGPELPTPPRELNPEASHQLERICMRCLSKAPAQRYRTAREVADALRALASSGENSPLAPAILSREPELVAPPSGAIALDSPYYLVRDADRDYEQALARSDSIVLVRGARQMGKTSLMARGLQQARQAGTHVVLTDFQKLNTSELQSADTLFMALGDRLAERLGLDVSPHDVWNARRGPSANFERFLRREIIPQLTGALVWGLDEVDRLFPCHFSSEVFGLFRSWHNERALDPAGPWSRLTLALAYATEAHLFITDINQSPFNVGTRISLADFSIEQVSELNRRYKEPLVDKLELARFVELVGGQPYLVNRSLYEMRQRKWNVATLVDHADQDDGIFGDHLRRMVVLLAQDESLRLALAGFVQNNKTLTTEQFYRLRSAGILSGDSAAVCRLRCGLYQRYLARQLR